MKKPTVLLCLALLAAAAGGEGAMTVVLGPADDEVVIEGSSSYHGVGYTWNAYRNYHRSQYLYLDSELGGLSAGGMITAIGHYKHDIYNELPDEMKRAQHWLKSTSDTVFADTSWTEPGTLVWGPSTLTLVTGTGWQDVVLAEPFKHFAGQNLLLSFRHQDSTRENVTRMMVHPVTPFLGKSGSDDAVNPPRMWRQGFRPHLRITYTPLTGMSEEHRSGIGHRVTVAPNPVAGRIATLRYELTAAAAAAVRVFDASGRLVVTRNLPAGVAGAAGLELPGSGVFLVEFSSGGRRTTTSLVVR